MSTNRAGIAKEAINDIEWGAIEGGNTEFSINYPRMQWFHGSKQAAGFMRSGGLFIAKEEYPHFVADGFEPTTAITREGSELEGFAASAAHLAVIRVKHQWVKDETYGKNVPLSQVLCVVKGCEDLVIISLKGPSKALDFQKAFNQHIAQNVVFANRTRPQGSNALEPFALWFPLIAGPHHMTTSKDGKSSSPVTSPELATPAVVDRAHVVSLWVGAENYRKFVGYYKDSAEWQKRKIWEQRDTEEETPAFSGETGNGNGVTDNMTEQQADFIGGIVEAKNIDPEDVKQMVLSVTEGATNNLRMLSKVEAAELISMLKGQ